MELHQVLWNNTGSTDDWPITLKVDPEMHDDLIHALNELSEAIREIDPDLVPWPLGSNL